MRKVFGDAAFPERMDAMLVGELSIVIDGSVEGDVGIGDVVSQYGAPPDDLGDILLSEGFYELRVGVLDGPG